MTRTRNFLLALLLAILPPLSPAAASGGDIDLPLQLAGVTDQVKRFPQLIKDSMCQAQLDEALISQHDFSAMLIRTDDTIVPDEILAEVRYALQQALSKEDIERLLAW